MSTSITLFCEHCGAANETQATCCCFCGKQLQAPRTANYDEESGCLLSDAMLKGRYRIIKAVGQGGMGTVYRAQDTELNYRAVAIKEMIVRGLNAQQAQEATETFKREATLLASLQHANLPSVFEYFEENDRWYMVMSFIQGETLEDYLKRTNRNKLPLTEVLQIGKQLCTALHYLHSQPPPIIFRDVKPANIMRTPDGQIYLIDFGVARRFKPGQKKDTTPFGSIGYAPPEQFNKAQTTPRSDIYSLGATLYQLLTGHEPDSTPFRFPPLQSLEPGVPKPLVTLIEQMLEIDAKKRPASMLIVEQELQEINSSAATLQPFALPKPTTPRKQGSPFVRSMIFLGILCMVIGGFIGSGIGTAAANATNQAHVYATATAVNATATVLSDAQTRAINAAQLIAAQPNPYSPKGTLALVDPLDQSGAWQPQADTSNGESCQFQNGALQISQAPPDIFYDCKANALFKNFIIQVNMTITQGNCGGITLRESVDGLSLYKFEVCSDSSYAFYLYTPQTTSDSTKTLKEGSTPSAVQMFQTNTLAIVANGSTFDLYLNGHKLDSASDNSYNIGSIGLVAHARDENTTVTYQDAIIWALP